MGTRKFIVSVLVGVLSLLTLGTAQANPAIPHDANETSTSKAIQQRAIELGVSPAIALQLAANLEQGKLPDSDLGVKPEATFETRSSGQVERREIYPDGSVSVSSVPDLEAVAQSTSPQSDGTVRPFNISGCRYTYTSTARTWHNCQIQRKSLTVFMAFRFDATHVRGQSAKITRAYDQQNTSFFGTTSHISFGRVGSQSAVYKVQWSAIKDVSSRTNTLAATISNDGVMSSKFY